MGHNMERLGGKFKKNVGKMTGNYKLQVRGAIQENQANLKDRWLKPG